MVAVKGRNSLKGSGTQGHKMSNTAKNLKIYVESDKVKTSGSLNNTTKDTMGRTSLKGGGTQGHKMSNTAKNLKIYVESDKVKTNGSLNNATKDKPITRDGQQYPFSADAKKIIKKSGKSISKPGRKVLADIGNVRSTFSKIEEGKGSRLGKSAGIPLHMTRKSLPVLKHTSRVETTDRAKDNLENLGKFGGKHSLVFPVKSSVKRSIVPKPSTVKSRPWGNRISDASIVMESRVQTKVDARVLSKKNVKPTVKAAAASFNIQRNPKSQHMLNIKNLRSKPADLPNRELGMNISGGTVIFRRKSERRNSYTGSLVSRSKLLKEHSGVPLEETLPSIDDDHNHLEVSEYVDDIYQYYWVMEGQNPLLENYMEKQGDITPQMRGILINWLVEVHLRFDLMEETLFLTVTLLDRYLSVESIIKNDMQLVGLTALLLASKYEDFWHPRVTDLISISAESYSRDEMLNMEKAILKKLKFRLNEPTPYVFLLRFLKAAQSDVKFDHLAFYLIELCLIEYEALSYKASMLCASAIYVARCTLQMTPFWTPLLAKHARYQESNIRECAEAILKFHKAAATTPLKVTYEKYSKPDYSRVATIKPLDRLPRL